MVKDRSSRQTELIAFVVLSITVVIYFTELQSPVKPAAQTPAPFDSPVGTKPLIDGPFHESVLPATRYADMPAATYARAKVGETNLAKLLKSRGIPLANIRIRPSDKETALTFRDRNRAFNGAPPTIPHPVDQRSDRACIACHGVGVKTASLRIPRMSHQYLANCTQCHVENSPRHIMTSVFRENSFAGLAAPTAGPRAFPGAPPVIPHSTWMRRDCMSCHGPTGLYGIRTTHPWRQNCQQCHAPSAILNQTPLGTKAQFLPPPIMEVESRLNRASQQDESTR
ncbi:MAG: diheme cytochrome c precursor [Planctomycetaceae bacterium]|jgi:nitrate reductase (cytochrome), electron transfer subunit|nr:diheme cytochrome c precursor [Planctomycetaceae bacterium]MBT6494863.1 diheme cytochrome c precursor [Planctomycetaceae bacterium]